VLAYLDALVAAIAARNAAEISRLLAHPLARTLTRDGRLEAEQVAAGVATVAPLRLLQLRHQTAQLLGAPADSAEHEFDAEAAGLPQAANRGGARAPSRHQMELPLSA
jgi:hypothetical protein